MKRSGRKRIILLLSVVFLLLACCFGIVHFRLISRAHQRLISVKASAPSADGSAVMQTMIRSRSSVPSADSRFRTASSMENVNAAPSRYFTTGFCLRNSTGNASIPVRYRNRPIPRSCTIRGMKRSRRTSISICLTDIPNRNSTMCWC